MVLDFNLGLFSVSRCSSRTFCVCFLRITGHDSHLAAKHYLRISSRSLRYFVFDVIYTNSLTAKAFGYNGSKSIERSSWTSTILNKFEQTTHGYKKPLQRKDIISRKTMKKHFKRLESMSEIRLNLIQKWLLNNVFQCVTEGRSR